MDAWKKIGRGINLVKVRNHSRKNIVPLKRAGAEIMAVGIHGGRNEKYRHPHKKKNAEPVVFLFIFK